MPPAIAKTIHRQDLPYNTPDDYGPIIKAANLPIMLAVHARTPWKTAKEALDFICANPSRNRVGSPGNGSMGHLTLVALNTGAGTRFAHVSYHGRAESIPSMLGGHIEALAVHPPEILPHTAAGTARVLATLEDKRNVNDPAAPTLRELGYNLALGVYHPLIGPKGPAKDIRDKRYRAAKGPGIWGKIRGGNAGRALGPAGADGNLRRPADQGFNRRRREGLALLSHLLDISGCLSTMKTIASRPT